MNNKNPNERKAEIIASGMHASPTFTLFIKAEKQKCFLLLVTLECCINRDRNKDNTFHFPSKCVL